MLKLLLNQILNTLTPKIESINLFFACSNLIIKWLFFWRLTFSRKSLKIMLELYCLNLQNYIGGLQTKWFSKFFSKKICIIHFDKHQILSRMVVIWNHQSHVVALESKSYWKFVNQFPAHLRTIWRHHGYQNDPLLIVRGLTEPDFWYRKYFRFYSKMHFSTFRHQQNVFVLS